MRNRWVAMTTLPVLILNKAHQRGRMDESTASIERVPPCLEWTAEEVADWIESLGYKEYRVNGETGPVQSQLTTSSPINAISVFRVHTCYRK